MESSNKRRGPVPKEGPACGLTKQKFLEAIAAGETTSSIEKAWGMKYNTLYEWVKRWDLRGINMEKAAEMIAGREAAPEEPTPVTQGTSTTPAEHEELVATIERLRSELERARAAAADSVALAGEAAAKFKAEIDELRIDRDEWRRTATELKDKVNFQTTHIAGQEERIWQLEEDLDLNREPVIIEKAAAPAPGIITLQIPLVDTGEQEIEDRLQSLVTIGDLKGKINLREFNLPRLMLETLNRLQVIVGIIQAQTADIVEPADVARTVQQFASRHNDTHVAELRVMAAARGWEVLGTCS